MKKVSTVEFRNNFSDLVNRAAYGIEPVIMSKMEIGRWDSGRLKLHQTGERYTLLDAAGTAILEG